MKSARKSGEERHPPGGTPTGDALSFGRMWERRHMTIAVVTIVCLGVYLFARYLVGASEEAARPALLFALILGGGPLVGELTLRLWQREFGSDLIAGISIVTAILLGEYLAGTLVVLMLSGGEALESMAVRRASSVLEALARRIPSRVHRETDSGIEEISLDQIEVGDHLLVRPHEICPVDGIVERGHGSMDEAYLTGEPYRISKSVGSDVISGAINGEAALTIKATKRPIDSRYARIVRVMEESQQRRPKLRRLGDQLGAIYTPLAVAIALGAWAVSGEVIRFLAVLVVATPCPLLIGIPVAIIGSVSLAARRSIIIRDPAVLERISSCRTMIFDKTGTLTYGEPTLVEQHVHPAFEPRVVLQLVASVEQYSKHPLATAVIQAAQQEGISVPAADEVHEPPGEGLRGVVEGRSVRVTSRKVFTREQPQAARELPESSGGLECVILIDERYAGTYRFRDEPRPEGARFIGHLAPMHGFDKVMLVSGDRLSEVEYLAEQVGITELYASKSPEEKVRIVRAETEQESTVYVGDGVNDAPAMLEATVGLAMGQRSEVTTEAAGAVLMDNKLGRVDELLHIGTRMRRIAMQTAVGGMALSFAGMTAAAAGYLPPVTGAILQEIIDLLAVANALRAAWPPKSLTDY